MRKAIGLLGIIIFLSSGFLSAQILTPVVWSWKAEKTGVDEYKLIFSAKIDKNWHTYSQYIGDGGPVPTKFTFDAKNKDVQLIGKTTETGPKIHEGHDPVFDMQLKYFEVSMTCEQKVKILKDTKLTGTLEFMVCDDSKCLPPDDKDFEFVLTKGGVKVEPVKDNNQKNVKGQIENTNQGTDVKSGSAKAGSYSSEGNAFDSAVQSVIATSITKDSVKAAITTASLENKFGKPISNCGTAIAPPADRSLLTVILLGFLAGLISLVTPCVFPMIPLTVTFFTKRSESKTKGKSEALFYAISIIAIYVIISLPFALFNSASDTLNELSTGAPLNVVFFVIFVFFAFSFLGYYEITLPSVIANKADSASNVGGLIGIFFMALTLAIVSFSCTGPILGSLLVGALTTANGKLNVVVGMAAFGTGLALPFGVFALFPSMMKSLPKSGGWLDTVKKVLGFVEFIFAFKFLSNADLVSHWNLLPREIFLGIWAVIGFGLFLFLIGKLNLPHTSPVAKLPPLRIGAALFALIFSIYNLYGIPGNDLSLLSGFPPPKFYSLFKEKLEIVAVGSKSIGKKHSDVRPIQNDYDAALALAKKEGKPIMIDFTGWACVNCRKMEENVWTDSLVNARLTENFVVLSLYVDDKKELPEAEQRMSDFFKGKKIRTVGNRNSEMQAKYFGVNSQPYYVLITPDEHLLNTPRPYTPAAKEYAEFLDCGINAYKQISQR